MNADQEKATRAAIEALRDWWANLGGLGWVLAVGLFLVILAVVVILLRLIWRGGRSRLLV